MKCDKFKVLLINPPSVCLIPKKYTGISFYDYIKISEPDYEHMPGEHLGIQYIAAYLDKKREDTDVSLLNACVENHTSLQQTLEAIKSVGKLDVIGFSGPINIFEEVLWLATEIKKINPNIKLVYGQYFASLNYDKILNKYPIFDYVCVGDGEIPFERFISYLNKEIPITEVPSFAYRQKNTVCLNKIPYSYEELKKLTPRREYSKKVLDSGMNLSISTSRGCPYRCSFCVSGSLMSKNPHINQHILRDSISVVDELEELYQTYKIKKVVFVDDTFAANTKKARQQARGIAQEIIKRNLNLSIMIDTRVDCIDEELFTLLRRAGIEKAFVGIESNTSSGLTMYNKGYKQENIQKQLNILKKLQIKVIPGLINFNPTSTIPDLLQNTKFILGLDKDYCITLGNSFLPYPGTILTDKLIKSGYVVGEFPNYQIKYAQQNIELLKDYFQQFISIYVDLRSKTTSPITISKLEDIAQSFFINMIHIANQVSFNNLLKQYFNKTKQHIYMIDKNNQK